jgi:hypothetical protein
MTVHLTTTAAHRICDCHKCGHPVYQNLVHYCATAVGPMVWAGWYPQSDPEPAKP